jgi:hypothetical protein
MKKERVMHNKTKMNSTELKSKSCRRGVKTVAEKTKTSGNNDSLVEVDQGLKNADFRPVKFRNVDEVPQLDENGDIKEIEKTYARTLKKVTGEQDTKTAAALLDKAWFANTKHPNKDLDTLNAITTSMFDLRPYNSMEARLLLQMWTLHEASMKCFAKGIQQSNNEIASKNQDQGMKLSNAFTRLFAVWVKGRTGNSLNLNVKRIEVNDGGQAIVGNFKQGGKNGKEEK